MTFITWSMWSLSAATYAADVMKRVAPKDTPETTNEGAALASSKAGFAVSSAKASTLASLVGDKVHAYSSSLSKLPSLNNRLQI